MSSTMSHLLSLLLRVGGDTRSPSASAFATVGEEGEEADVMLKTRCKKEAAVSETGGGGVESDGEGSSGNSAW